MKKIAAVLIFLFLLSTFTLGENPGAMADPKMTKEEREYAVKALLDAEKETLGAIENLTDAQWNFRPAPFKWTVGETAEHIALAEGLLFQAMERALAAPVNPDWEAKTSNKQPILE